MSLPYPVFSTVPDFSTAPQYGLQTGHDRLAIAQGRARVAFPNKQPDRVFGFAFTLETATEIRSVKEFLRDRGGRTHPFYLPSWRNDLPPLAGTVGSNLLTVSAEDYEATHLTEPATRADHYGRQIFVWQPGEDLHTTRIIGATEPTTATTVLDIEDLLPFTIDPAKAIVGFCHLARFMEDRLDWEHWSDTAAKTTIKFKGIRQHNDIGQSNPVADFDFYGSLGFHSVTQAAQAVEPNDSRIGYAAGPYNLHNSQDELYQTRWAAWLFEGAMRLRKKPTGSISLPDSGGATSALFTGANITTDHITLAFDQNGWEVIAYQKTATTIELRQFFNFETTIRTWDGIDPVLVYNQLLDPNLEDGDSDVVCYYLKPGNSTLYARFQRENFLIENTVTLLPLRPLALKRTWIEGQIQYLELMDAGFRSAILQTDSYPDPPAIPPLPFVDAAGTDHGAVALEVSGDYAVAIVYSDGTPYDAPTHPAHSEAATAAAELLAEYVPSIVYSDGLPLGAEHEPHSDEATTGLELRAAHEQTIVESAGHEDSAVVGLAMSVDYTLTIINPPGSTDAAATNLALTAVYEI